MLLLMLPLALPLMAQEDKQNEEFDWNPVIDAIIEIESRGNERARNENQKKCLSSSCRDSILKTTSTRLPASGKWVFTTPSKVPNSLSTASEVS